ncbi:methyltransferase [Streptomyces sp. NBC_00433]
MNRSSFPAPAGAWSRSVADAALFLTETARTFHTTGAVAPSSRRLSRALAAPLLTPRPGRQPLAVLEVGAGTGAVSRVLANRLRPGDTLDLVEANPRFANRLRADRRLEVDGERIRLIEQPVGELAHGGLGNGLGSGRYDVIVSGLPFANFLPHEVAEALAFYRVALKPGGHLTYFAYRGTSRARALVPARRAADRRRAVLDTLAHWRQSHDAVDSRTVWANLPPARVWHLRAAATVATAAGSDRKGVDVRSGPGGTPKAEVDVSDRA